MGNHRFRLSDMMPNAWFYKLKDMGRTRNHNSSSHSINKKQSKSSPPQQTQPNQLHFSHPRDSYYFSTGDRVLNSPVNPKSSDTHFPDPPRKSSRRRIKRKSINSSPKLVSSSISAGCNCRTTLDSVWTKPVYYSEENEDLQETNLPQFGSDLIAINGGSGSCSSSCSCRVSSSPTDIIIDSVSELELPPILTKPVKFNEMITNMKKKDAIDAIEAAKFRRSLAKLKERNSHESLSVKVVKQESIKTLKEQKPSPPLRRSSTASPGLKLRSNSPRISSRKIQSYSRKSISSSTTSSRSRKKNVSESFAIVKSSFNPRKDFRDSMVEMIMENNIRASKDLEELLACYLSLNSNEYHDLIVKVFEQIWFEITDIQL